MSIKTYSYKKSGSKSLSKHFKVCEFVSNVNGKNNYDTIKIDTNLINKLEKLFAYGIDAIIITSGYRHPNDSVAVGGHANDAHTKGIAADIICYKDGNCVSSKITSCLAQLIGFNGIGIISSNSIHVDTRTTKTYTNEHWWGDERNDNDNITDFFKYHKTTKAKVFGELEYYKEKCYYIKATEKAPIRVKPDKDAKIKKYYEKGKKARIFAEKGKWGKVASGWIYLSKTRKV